MEPLETVETYSVTFFDKEWTERRLPGSVHFNIDDVLQIIRAWSLRRGGKVRGVVNLPREVADAISLAITEVSHESV